MKKLIILVLLPFFIIKSYGQTLDFVNKLNVRALPLDSTFSFKQSDSVDYLTLLKKLNTYKALGIGEATHGTHEFFVAKSNLIKRLITFNHFDRIGLEASYAEVENLNQYLTKNEGDLNEILKSFRQYTYETKEFADLINYIKIYNTTAKIKVLFYGYDFQSPYKVLNNIRSVLKDPPAISAADSLISIFNSLSNELYSHQIDSATYRKINNNSKKMYKELDKITDPVLLKNLNNYRQFVLINNPLFSHEIGKISEIRDSIMAKNILNELNLDHHMLVWAHNGHVQKTASKFSQSMGQHLTQLLNKDYATIGLATYEGFYTGYNNNKQGVVSTNPLVTPNPSQIEYYLKQVKYKNFIIETKDLNVPSIIIKHRLLGYGVTEDQFQNGNMFNAFDFILFIANTTGSYNYYIKKE